MPIRKLKKEQSWNCSIFISGCSGQTEIKNHWEDKSSASGELALHCQEVRGIISLVEWLVHESSNIPLSCGNLGKMKTFHEPISHEPDRDNSNPEGRIQSLRLFIRWSMMVGWVWEWGGFPQIYVIKEKGNLSSFLYYPQTLMITAALEPYFSTKYYIISFLVESSRKFEEPFNSFKVLND